MADYPKIESVSLSIDATAIQRAVANIVGQLVEAEVTEKVFGEEACADRYGGKMDVPRAGKVKIGKSGSLAITLTIEPDGDGWAGSELQHDDIDALRVTGFNVDGQEVRK